MINITNNATSVGVNAPNELVGQNRAEKTSQTKVEAGAVGGVSQAIMGNIKNYQLEMPIVSAFGKQGQEVSAVINEVRSSVMQLTKSVLNTVSSEPIFKSSADAVAETKSLFHLLLEITKLSREQQTRQRDIATNANVTSLKTQAAELRSSTYTMIAMAVVSGVVAGVTAAFGANNSAKASKNLKSDMGLSNQVKMQQKAADDIEKLNTAGISDSMRAQLNKAKAESEKIKARIDPELQINKTQSDKLSSSFAAKNSVLQTTGQMSNSAVNIHQTSAQAATKDAEIIAALAQASKEKVGEGIANVDTMLNHILEIYRTYVEAMNQASRTAANV